MHTRSTSQAYNRCPSILLLFLAIWFVGPPPSIHPKPLQGVPDGPPSPETCTAHAPVTNECIEAGLRRRRELLRAEPAFQVNSPATHLKLAEILNQQGDPNGAIEEYRAAIQLDPDLPGAFQGLGAVYLDQHEWKQAEGALDRATQLGSGNSQTEYWLGRSRLAQQKFHEAQQAFSTATKLNPYDAEAFSDLGLTYMAQGHPTQAIKALRQAISLRPDYSEAHSRLELVDAFKHNQDQLVIETAKILHFLFRRE
ncbi:tetratricopeptide repeat protein [Candidatus Nitrospira allomarina]|uniref:Tetratricopeptide repeat protein n=1 Tax=Candidatus Nitrospira allomarina TaxID=3020900 RepID=A0AA96JWJ6_9BACT|nr:tetratricopeptide repeat protein [Candidatus Nitrospira allomarina]WNM57976.1 tetratricopeptide repeat protein [Candidatus Nitrospira allomarina]